MQSGQFTSPVHDGLLDNVLVDAGQLADIPMSSVSGDAEIPSNVHVVGSFC